MDKVKIKRVKRNKKKTTTAEKILAGIGVGSTLMGGAAATAGKGSQTQFVRTNESSSSTSSQKIKSELQNIFGVGVAKADSTLTIDPTVTQQSNANGDYTLGTVNGQSYAVQNGILYGSDGQPVTTDSSGFTADQIAQITSSLSAPTTDTVTNTSPVAGGPVVASGTTQVVNVADGGGTGETTPPVGSTMTADTSVVSVSDGSGTGETVLTGNTLTADQTAVVNSGGGTNDTQGTGTTLTGTFTGTGLNATDPVVLTQANINSIQYDPSLNAQISALKITSYPGSVTPGSVLAYMLGLGTGTNGINSLVGSDGNTYVLENTGAGGAAMWVKQAPTVTVAGKYTDAQLITGINSIIYTGDGSIPGAQLDRIQPQIIASISQYTSVTPGSVLAFILGLGTGSNLQAGQTVTASDGKTVYTWNGSDFIIKATGLTLNNINSTPYDGSVAMDTQIEQLRASLISSGQLAQYQQSGITPGSALAFMLGLGNDNPASGTTRPGSDGNTYVYTNSHWVIKSTSTSSTTKTSTVTTDTANTTTGSGTGSGATSGSGVVANSISGTGSGTTSSTDTSKVATTSSSTTSTGTTTPAAAAVATQSFAPNGTPLSGENGSAVALTPAFITTDLPSATVGAMYGSAFQVGSYGATSFSVVSGNLPPGLTLESNGHIQGSPTQAGAYVFSIKASNQYGSTVKQYKISVSGSASTTGTSQVTAAVADVTLASGFKGLQMPPGYPASGGGLQMPDGYAASSGQVLGTQTSAGSYTVKKGDTLASISKQVYGDSKHWRKILSANPNSLSIPSNTKTLKIGAVLTLPSIINN